MTAPLTMKHASAYLAEKHQIDIKVKNLREHLRRRLLPMAKARVGGERLCWTVTEETLDKFLTMYTPDGHGSKWRSPNNDPFWMSFKQIMAEQGISRNTANWRARKYQWTKKKIGKAVYFLRKDVEAPPPKPKPRSKRSNTIAYHSKQEVIDANRALITEQQRRCRTVADAVVLERGEGAAW